MDYEAGTDGRSVTAALWDEGAQLALDLSLSVPPEAAEVRAELAGSGPMVAPVLWRKMTLTPCTGSHTWREPFFEGYGSWPSLDGYKMRLFYYVLYEMGKQHSRAVPDARWLRGRWPDLLQASDWGELAWFPIERKE